MMEYDDIPSLIPRPHPPTEREGLVVRLDATWICTHGSLDGNRVQSKVCFCNDSCAETKSQMELVFFVCVCVCVNTILIKFQTFQQGSSHRGVDHPFF